MSAYRCVIFYTKKPGQYTQQLQWRFVSI